jgi:hypothetical protein
MKVLRNALLATIIWGLITSLCLAAETPLFNPNAQPTREPDSGKRFDLDFKGGPPKALVDAVEKAVKEPLNVIIPEEHRDFDLPPLKLRDVTVPQLFKALELASQKSATRYFGNSFQRVNTKYGFRTDDRMSNAAAIWYFYVEDPGGRPTAPPPTQECRFWNLEPYLEKVKVEDITTAVETGWKMLGVNPLPKLTFHKDTKLLVVVGQQDQLRIVDDVLRELTSGPKPPKNIPSAPAPARQ